MIVPLVFFVLGGRAQASTCSSGKALTTNIDYTYCEGLTPLPSSSITQEQCEQACCDDPNCYAWQYCPYGESCFDLNRKNYQRTPCLTGAVPTKCGHTKLTRFVGRTSAKPGTLLPVRTAPVTRKRGMSGMLDNQVHSSVFSCQDPELLGLKDSWYYNWGSKSTQADRCLDEEGLWGADIAGEYVPMIESTRGDPSKIVTPERIADWERGNAQFLLGYNEPDRNSETSLMGAQHWPSVQAAAAMFNPPLKLVTAAPSETDFDEHGASKWLDGFFKYCEFNVTGCDPELIDYIGYHDYSGNLTLVEQRINGMAQRYKKKDGTVRKIWLTEVGVGRWLPPNGPPTSEKLAYMPKLLKMLDNNPYIYRYAWFSAHVDVDYPKGRRSWAGETGLFENIGKTLTALGEAYKVPQTSSELVAPAFTA